jgi:hypothetical protein
VTNRFPARLAAWLDALRHPVVVVGLGMVALQLVFRAWAVFTSFFYTDDYQLLLQAQRSPLSLSHLMEPYNSHVMPGTRLLIWLVEASGPLNWGLAGTLTLVVQALASLAALWMLVVLFGRRWFVLAPLTLYLTSAITAQATLWWISSLNQISIQATFFLAVGTWVQYLRTGRHAWLLGSGLAVATGLLFFQKALLVLPVLVFVALVYFASGSPWRRAVVLVRSRWPALVVMGLVVGGYAVYSLSEVREPFTGGKELDLPELVWHMLGTFVVGALGGPWRWEWHSGGAWADTPTWLVVTAVLVALAIAAYSILTRRRAFWAWLLVLGFLVMQVALVATSRAPVFGAEIGLAYRLQTDIVCALVLGVGLAFASLPGSCQSSEPRGAVAGPAALSRLLVPVPTSWVAVAVALVGVSGVVCWTAYARSWHEHNVSESYLRTLDRDLGRTGRIDVVDAPVPDAIMPSGFFAPDNRVSTMTQLLDRRADFPDSSSRLAVVDNHGGLREGLVAPVAFSEPGTQPDCGWLGKPPRLRIPLAGSTYDFGWWVRLGYLSNREDDVTVVAGDDRVPAHLQKGLANLYVRAGGEIDAVTVTGLDSDTRICVDVVQVGTMQEGRRQ